MKVHLVIGITSSLIVSICEIQTQILRSRADTNLKQRLKDLLRDMENVASIASCAQHGILLLMSTALLNFYFSYPTHQSVQIALGTMVIAFPIVILYQITLDVLKYGKICVDSVPESYRRSWRNVRLLRHASFIVFFGSVLVASLLASVAHSE